MIINRVKKLWIISLTVFLFSALMISPIHAVKSYNVTFRAGSQGTFGSQTSEVDQVSFNGTVSADTHVGNLTIADGYYFNGWNYTVKNPVQKTATYVAQYKKIINTGVYHVRYIDNYGNEVATQKVVNSQVGIVVAENAVNIEGYAADAVTKTVTVEKTGTEIIFIYVSTQTTGVETITQNNVVIVRPDNTNANANANTNTAGGTGGIGTEEIDEDQTPLAPGQDSSNNQKTPQWALINLIVAVCTVILTAIVLTKKNDTLSKKKLTVLRLIASFVGLGAIALFILTENLTLPMGMIDDYTIIMGCIFIANIVVTVFALKQKK